MLKEINQSNMELFNLLISYLLMISFATICVWIGSVRSLIYRKKEENMTSKDVAMFPVIASFFLFSLYILFWIFGKEYINLILVGWFLVVGIATCAQLLSPGITMLISNARLSKWNKSYKINFISIDSDYEEEVLINSSFDYSHLGGGLVGLVLAFFYYKTKHWLFNNMFGVMFSIFSIQCMSLGTIKNGFILLGGLFLYDIFWVFGTDVMVTVATSFDAPIKLLLPKDVLNSGLLNPKHFSMLGLGDIVVPGFFIGLVLRFDRSKSLHLVNFKKPYFYITLIAYVIGLCLTVFVLHIFKAAQPALLYIVPTCLGFPTVTSLLCGQFKEFWNYSDEVAIDDTSKKNQ